MDLEPAIRETGRTSMANRDEMDVRILLEGGDPLPTGKYRAGTGQACSDIFPFYQE